MIENCVFDIVDNYINNEINYIQAKEDCTSLDKYDIADLYRLQNMNDEEKWDIVNEILEDNELEDKINEIIHYCLYEKEV